MFTGGLRESERDTVRLQGVCPTVLAHLLCFMYTGEIVINEMLVCQLLPAATMFQVSSGYEIQASLLHDHYCSLVSCFRLGTVQWVFYGVDNNISGL